MINILKKIFCLHIFFFKTGNILGDRLHEWECQKCGKKIFREYFNPPVNFIEKN